MDADLHLIILAGGSGSRATRSEIDPPKQYAEVGGRPLILWSIASLCLCERVATLCVVCADDRRDLLSGMLMDAGINHPIEFASPGETRTASTWSALSKLSETKRPKSDDLVAVHDAARPFASADLLMRLAAAAAKHGGAVPGVMVSDTVVNISSSDQQTSYLQRESLRAVQTPQVFRWGPFFEAHGQAQREGSTYTDDGGLMASKGQAPVLVEGESTNWKVTTAEDLRRAAFLLGGNP